MARDITGQYSWLKKRVTASATQKCPSFPTLKTDFQSNNSPFGVFLLFQSEFAFHDNRWGNNTGLIMNAGFS